MADIRLQGVTVVRDLTTVLDGLDLDVPDGQRLVVLGPSGAGKTMLLRTIAGLERVTDGRVLFDGKDVTDLQVRDRDITMIFAQGGLQPHLDVGHNIGLPLRFRRRPREEIRERVQAEARAFGLERLLRRRPATLSGGEHHQVSLARSLVRRSNALLVDEPLTALDAGRRVDALRELVTVQEGYGVTMVVATNNADLARSLAHHLAVLDRGRLVEQGPAQRVHDEPATLLALQLTSSLPVTVLPGRVEQREGRTTLVAPPLAVTSFLPALRDLRAQQVQVAFRAEHATLAGDDDGHGVFTAQVRRTEFLGGHTRVIAGRSPSEAIEALVTGPAPREGERARFRVEPSHLHVFDTTGAALAHGV